MTQQQTDMVQMPVEKRTVFGKQNRRLRRAGKTPLNLYGPKHESQALQAVTSKLISSLRTAGRTKAVVLEVGKERIESLVRDVMIHPVSGKVLHADFMRVSSDHEISAEVPIKLQNTASAPVARGSKFLVMQVAYKVNLRAKLVLMPHLIEVDCGALEDPSEKIMLADIKLPAGVRYAGDDDLQIVSIQMSRAARAASTPDETPEDEAEAEASDKPDSDGSAENDAKSS